jgi:hypothetical protein
MNSSSTSKENNKSNISKVNNDYFVDFDNSKVVKESCVESISSKMNKESSYESNIPKDNNNYFVDFDISKVKKESCVESVNSKANEINANIFNCKSEIGKFYQKNNKKYNLNILYYDEHLRNNEENSDNCSFIEMNSNGTFYGCHNFDLFKIVCEKIIKNKKEFILISSGSAANKVFDYCRNIKEIREFYIYCFQKEKYLPLKDQYSKLKEVYNIFSHLKNKLYDIKEMEIDNISSSNLIFFEDYSRIYIKLHYEFIRKYSLYKILMQKKCNEKQFLYLVETKYPKFLNIANQLFPNKDEIVNYFKKNIKDAPNDIDNSFQNDDKFLDDNIQDYINNYTVEGFYYKYLNKFLREGNFDAFRILSSHVAKFIFKLYDYREKNRSKQKNSNLYRKMYLNQNDIKLYEKSIGKVICYPSFTSTSIKKNGYNPPKNNPNDELVLLIINQNNTKSTVSIGKLSNFPNEKEYLFLPFSFFKIQNIELKTGSENDPHLIHLLALNSDKSIEEMFLNFFTKETDNLNPEGLDLLILNENKTKIIFNPIYLSHHDVGCECMII